MLTADLVDARKKDGELVLRSLDRAGRAEALTIATSLLDAAQGLVGRRREELEEAWDAAANDVAPKRFKLAAGLRKLAADACVFEAETDVDPIELRRVLFTHASEVRRRYGTNERFDRDAVVAEAATMLGVTPEIVDRAMFADLRSEHVLRAAPSLDAESLVEAWELGQAQAVLLTAVRITCEIRSASPGLVRAFFAKLKFQKLLFTAERIGEDAGDPGWKVVIDGPYSMFDAVTKYGLRLAFAFPALRALERWSLVADIRWGKAREALVFRAGTSGAPETTARSAPPADGSTPGPEPRAKRSRRRRESADTSPSSHDAAPARTDTANEGHLADDVRELLDGVNALGSGWRARAASTLLDVPGMGICIPDLELSRDGARTPIYVEVLGYWSRDAVFRRAALAESGLGARVVFAVSSRLRVSAEILDETVPSSIYVYKGKMSPRAVIDHATRLAALVVDDTRVASAT